MDERVELVSLVFRLAGAREYNDQNYKEYIERINNHFSSYKNHELIQFSQKLINENYVGYDRVMRMAVKLDKNFNFKKDISLEGLYKDYGGKENAEKFVCLLKQFYKDSNAKKFFKNNKDIYTEVEAKFAPMYKMIDQNWYSSFFGKQPKEKFIVLLGVGNGGGNYGSQLNYYNGKREVYSILGAGYSNLSDFKAEYYLSTLIHEFAHSFIDIPDKKIFRESAEKIQSLVGEQMAQQAYGDKDIIIAEGFVRAAVIKYMKDHNMEYKTVADEIAEQKQRGFFWVEDLVKEMGKYSSDREKYPTFADYMPQFAKAHEKYYDLGKEIERNRPQIISINEFKNGATDVDPEIKTITMNFDKALKGKGFSIFNGSKGQSSFPKTENVLYENDNKSVVMQVKLEPNKEYEFVMKGLRFVTPDGYAMKDYRVYFKTK